MLVKDIMVKTPKIIDAGTSIFEAAKLMADQNVGFLPVQANDKIIGMLTDRDITLRVVATSKDAKKTKAQDVMSKSLFYCYENDTLESVLDTFGKKQIHRMPVMNANKKLVGEISLGDIARAAKKDEKLYALIGKAKELICKAA